MTHFMKLCLFLSVLVLGLLFHMRNEQYVVIDYYLGTFQFPLSATVVLVLSLGVLLGFLVGIPARVRLKREKSRLARKLDVAEKEINALRAIPVKDDL